jgi:hypothetical protein
MSLKKYLKYKEKYLQLKKKLSFFQIGGAKIGETIINLSNNKVLGVIVSIEPSENEVLYQTRDAFNIVSLDQEGKQWKVLEPGQVLSPRAGFVNPVSGSAAPLQPAPGLVQPAPGLVYQHPIPPPRPLSFLPVHNSNMIGRRLHNFKFPFYSGEILGDYNDYYEIKFYDNGQEKTAKVQKVDQGKHWAFD